VSKYIGSLSLCLLLEFPHTSPAHRIEIWAVNGLSINSIHYIRPGSCKFRRSNNKFVAVTSTTICSQSHACFASTYYLNRGSSRCPRCSIPVNGSADMVSTILLLIYTSPSPQLCHFYVKTLLTLATGYESPNKQGICRSQDLSFFVVHRNSSRDRMRLHHP